MTLIDIRVMVCSLNGVGEMLTLELAETQQHYEELLELICHQSASCFGAKSDWVQLTCEQFGVYFRTTGLAYRICQDKRCVGLCWVEEWGCRLYVHGLIIRPEYQGRGWGQQALEMLQARYKERMEIIELSVHASNPRAKALYERLSFHVVDYQEDSGFYVMQKAL